MGSTLSQLYISLALQSLQYLVDEYMSMKDEYFPSGDLLASFIAIFFNELVTCSLNFSGHHSKSSS